jgi:hypothetical protein
MIDAVPPSWAQVSVQVMSPNPAPAAPSTLGTMHYVCDLHNHAAIGPTFEAALKSLPPVPEST